MICLEESSMLKSREAHIRFHLRNLATILSGGWQVSQGVSQQDQPFRLLGSFSLILAGLVTLDL